MNCARCPTWKSWGLSMALWSALGVSGVLPAQSWARTRKSGPQKTSQQHGKSLKSKKRHPQKDRNHHARKRRRTATQPSTGILTQHSALIQNPTLPGRRHSVALAAPIDEASSFVGDLNTVLMSQDIMNHIDREMRNRVGNTRIDSGFYSQALYSNAYMENQRDRRLSARLNGMTVAQDLEFRRQMAGLMKHFMVTKGLKEFLKSREDTKNLGEAYDQALSSTQTQFTSGSKEKGGHVWRYNVGTDPFRPAGVESWVTATDDQWTFEGRNAISRQKLMAGELGLQAMDPHLRMVRNNSLRDFGLLVTETKYFPLRHTVMQSVWHPFNARLSGGLECSVPYKADNVLKNVYSSASMKYDF